MKNFNIVYLCNEYPPSSHGGIGTVTQTLARAMVARGHQVSVIGLYEGKTDEDGTDDRGVRVIRLHAAGLPIFNFAINYWHLFIRLRDMHAQTPIDIIEGQEAAFAFLPASLPGKKIIRMHGGHHFFFTTLGKSPRLWRAWQEKRSFAKADFLCAVSRFVANTTCQLLRLEARPVEIIPNSIDTDLFCPQADVPTTDGRIVFVGTLCEKKGVRQLLQAFHAIHVAEPQARLLLIGRDTTIPATGKSYLASLQSEIPETMKAKIEFRGAIDHQELPAIYASAAVCVFPSHMEAQGLVVLEAMAVGKGVVAGKVGPGPELIDHGKDGLLCDPKNPNSIAEAIIRLLSDDKLRKEMGKLARQKAVNNFSNEVIIERNDIFYRKAVALN